MLDIYKFAGGFLTRAILEITCKFHLEELITLNIEGEIFIKPITNNLLQMHFREVERNPKKEGKAHNMRRSK